MCRVQGKSDTHPVVLMMWLDESNPAFCPVRHLLSWIRLINLKSGFLFPSYNELTKILTASAPAAITKDMALSYDTYQKRFRHVLEKLFPNCGPFGTHTNRKTGYMLAVWGGASVSSIMQSARHKSVAHANRYLRDSATLCDIMSRHAGLVSLTPSPFWPILLENFENVRALTQLKAFRLRNLGVLANHFFTSFSDLPLEHPAAFTQSTVVSRSLTVRSQASLQDDLLQLLSHFGADAKVVEQCIKMFQAHASRELQIRQGENQPGRNAVRPLESCDVDSFVQTSTVMTPEQECTPRKRSLEDLVERKQLKKLKSVREKVDALQMIM
jgi:hypothetical protein